jgi:hypothetical protein
VCVSSDAHAGICVCCVWYNSYHIIHKSQILMLRALLSQGGAALFVVPYVALAEEKASYFK